MKKIAIYTNSIGVILNVGLIIYAFETGNKETLSLSWLAILCCLMALMVCKVIEF